MNADQVLRAIKNTECVEQNYDDRTEDEIRKLDADFDTVYKAAKAWAKQQTGSWQVTEHVVQQLDGTLETYTRVVCSNCNQGNTWGEVPYCPWCGARMGVKS